MLKGILGVVLGAVVAMGLIMAAQYLVHMLSGAPAVDPNDGEAMKTMMASTPLSAKLGVIAGYLVAAGVGAWLAARIAGHRWAGWVVAGLLLATSAANFAMLPHPLWFMVATVVVIAGAGWMASRAGAKA
jgi:hypothetical protein